MIFYQLFSVFVFYKSFIKNLTNEALIKKKFNATVSISYVDTSCFVTLMIMIIVILSDISLQLQYLLL